MYFRRIQMKNKKFNKKESKIISATADKLVDNTKVICEETIEPQKRNLTGEDIEQGFTEAWEVPGERKEEVEVESFVASPYDVEEVEELKQEVEVESFVEDPHGIEDLSEEDQADYNKWLDSVEAERQENFCN